MHLHSRVIVVYAVQTTHGAPIAESRTVLEYSISLALHATRMVATENLRRVKIFRWSLKPKAQQNKLKQNVTLELIL